MYESTETMYRAEPLSSDAHLKPFEDLTIYLREYARERPEIVALACFGIGFVLGWKLKPW